MGKPLADGSLAGTYAIVSLWSSLELFMGVIAANVALSRSIYRFLRYGKTSGSQMRSEHATLGRKPKNGSGFSRYQFEVTTSTSQSESSDIWLQAGTRNNMEYRLEEAPDQQQARPPG